MVEKLAETIRVRGKGLSRVHAGNQRTPIGLRRRLGMPGLHTGQRFRQLCPHAGSSLASHVNRKSGLPAFDGQKISAVRIAERDDHCITANRVPVEHGGSIARACPRRNDSFDPAPRFLGSPSPRIPPRSGHALASTPPTASAAWRRPARVRAAHRTTRTQRVRPMGEAPPEKRFPRRGNMTRHLCRPRLTAMRG